VFNLIKRAREGEQIDSASLRKFVDMYMEIGTGHIDYYQNNFEDSMFEDARIYYARKDALWISEYSCPEYIVMAEKCLQNEEHRFENYLHSSNKHGLLEIVQNELLDCYEIQLLGKHDSGFEALLRDDKKIDISRMYMLFCKIPKGLQRVASIFQQHIFSRGINLVKIVEDTSSNNNSSNNTRIQGLEFLQKVIEIYDQYVDYLEHEFQNDNSISKALHKALVVIFNKKVAGTTST